MSVSYQDALAYYKIDGAHPGGLALTKTIMGNEKINRNTKILDAGCGTGQTSSYLAKAFSCSIYSVDKHPEMIKTATSRFKEENLRITILKASIASLPFPTDTFDFIIAESSTAFAPISKSLKEYWRVLKPSGVLLNIDITAEQRFTKDEKAEIMEFYKMNDILTEEEWMKAIKKAGFASVEVLKSNSVMQELEEYMVEENELSTEPFHSVDYDENMDDILQTHHKLAISYGEKLGYRVFRAKKLDILSYT